MRHDSRRQSVAISRQSGSHLSASSRDTDLIGIEFEHNGLLNDNRLYATVPSYESQHMRHYLTDWDRYQDNQPELKDNSNIRKNYTEHIKRQLLSLTNHERVEMILDSIPLLSDTMEDLRRQNLKYNILMNRINGKEIENILHGKLLHNNNKEDGNESSQSLWP